MEVTEVRAVYPRWRRLPSADAWQAHFWQIAVRVDTDVGVIGHGSGGGGQPAVHVINGHLRRFLVGRSIADVALGEDSMRHAERVDQAAVRFGGLVRFGRPAGGQAVERVGESRFGVVGGRHRNGRPGSIRCARVSPVWTSIPPCRFQTAAARVVPPRRLQHFPLGVGQGAREHVARRVVIAGETALDDDPHREATRPSPRPPCLPCRPRSPPRSGARTRRLATMANESSRGVVEKWESVSSA